MKELPKNVTCAGNVKTRSGKIVTRWNVECFNCGEKRFINRKDHAIRLSLNSVKSVLIKVIIRKENIKE